jgi:uncharacterized protein
MKVVLDCNVIVSGFPAWRGVPATILTAWADGRFDLVMSEHILARAISAWSDPYYRRRYAEREVQETAQILRSQTIMAIPAEGVHGVAPNDEDDVVLATAIAGGVDYLVTGDHPFRKVAEYQGVIILTPREFLTLLEEEEA